MAEGAEVERNAACPAWERLLVGYGCGRVAEAGAAMGFSVLARVGLGEKLCGLMNSGEGGESNTSFGEDSLE